MNRRNFIKLIAAALPLAYVKVKSKDDDQSIVNYYLLEGAVREFYEMNMFDLPFEQAVGEIGYYFRGTPYEGGTLEGPGPEVCRIFLDKFDCVTFYEVMLAIVRIIYKGVPTMEALTNEIIYMRYRSGVLDGYASRLHYSSDWIRDNIKKGVIKDITESLGGRQFNPNVSFMSRHPQYYPPLKNDKEMVRKIQATERNINQDNLWYIRKKNVEDIEDEIKTGDLIFITTSKAGLDYAHTGIAYQKDGVAHLLHASSQHKKVLLGPRISEYLKPIKSDTGISVLRPLEPPNE